MLLYRYVLIVTRLAIIIFKSIPVPNLEDDSLSVTL